MKTIEEIKTIRNSIEKKLAVRKFTHSYHIIFSMGTCGIASGARELLLFLVNEMNFRNTKNAIVTQSGTIDELKYEPMIKVIDSNDNEYLYVNLDKEKLIEILDEHIEKGNVLVKYLKEA